MRVALYIIIVWITLIGCNDTVPIENKETDNTTVQEDSVDMLPQTQSEENDSLNKLYYKGTGIR